MIVPDLQLLQLALLLQSADRLPALGLGELQPQIGLLAGPWSPDGMGDKPSFSIVKSDFLPGLAVLPSKSYCIKAKIYI